MGQKADDHEGVQHAGVTDLGLVQERLLFTLYFFKMKPTLNEKRN